MTGLGPVREWGCGAAVRTQPAISIARRRHVRAPGGVMGRTVHNGPDRPG